jgi:hypothetical protein
VQEADTVQNTASHGAMKPFNHIHSWHWMSGIEETGEFPSISAVFVRI